MPRKIVLTLLSFPQRILILPQPRRPFPHSFPTMGHGVLLLQGHGRERIVVGGLVWRKDRVPTKAPTLNWFNDATMAFAGKENWIGVGCWAKG
jgi:hypothetical protein